MLASCFDINNFCFVFFSLLFFHSAWFLFTFLLLFFFSFFLCALVMAFTYLTLLLLVYVLTRFWSPLYLIVPLFCKSWIGAIFLSILAVAEFFFCNKLVIEKTIGTGFFFSFRYLSFQLVWISVWIFFFFFP